MSRKPIDSRDQTLLRRDTHFDIGDYAYHSINIYTAPFASEQCLRAHPMRFLADLRAIANATR